MRSLIFTGLRLVVGILIILNGQLAYSDSAATAPATQPAISSPRTQSTADIVKRARQSVFLLKVRSKNAAVFATGTGFLVSHGSLAITNIHVLQGAESATAVFAEETEEHAVELLAFLPGYDLALIRIGGDLKGRLPLPLVSAAPDPGTEVYALGYPELGFTVTRGIVSGVRLIEKLPDVIKRAYDANSEWIQTDCTINPGNSGGPLLTAQEKVAGINTWVWLLDRNSYFALSARHIADLLKNAESEPISFKQLGGPTKMPSSRTTFPSLIVNTDVKPSTLGDAARKLAALGVCSGCKGLGYVDTHVQTGTRFSGGIHSVETPVYSKVTIACPTCKGVGIASPEKAHTQLLLTVDALVRLNVDAKGAVASKDEAMRRIRFLIEKAKDIPGFWHEWTYYSPRLRAYWRDSGYYLYQRYEQRRASSGGQFTDIGLRDLIEKYKRDDPKIGEPIAVVGWVGFELSEGNKRIRGRQEDTIPSDESRRFVAITSGHTGLLFVNPELNDAQTYEAVLAGGLLAGVVRDSEGNEIPVIQNGFILTLARISAPQTGKVNNYK